MIGSWLKICTKLPIVGQIFHQECSNCSPVTIFDLTGEQLLPVYKLSGSESLFLSSAKAEQVLGVTFRPLRETLNDTVVWYQSNGYLKGNKTAG